MKQPQDAVLRGWRPERTDSEGGLLSAGGERAGAPGTAFAGWSGIGRAARQNRWVRLDGRQPLRVGERNGCRRTGAIGGWDATDRVERVEVGCGSGGVLTQSQTALGDRRSRNGRVTAG
ncbi:MAG: hypothetical protein NZ561_11970 [Phycisphaerae bacterium]|nr:hypothetical protein [Phycisphaerae bacterium]MDW8263480.1 hypothetical protein [Phycisphaerales bacterium]